MNWRALAWRLAVLAGFAGLCHVGIVRDQPAWIAAAFLVSAALVWLGSGGPERRWIAAIYAGAGAVAAGTDRVGALVGWLPAVGYLLAMVTFAVTLRPGAEPLIARFCRLHFGRMPAECRDYARRLTVLWAGLMAALAAETAALQLAGRPGWIGPASALNLALMVALFVGEHAVRRRRFPHLPASWPWHTGRAMLRALWSR